MMFKSTYSSLAVLVLAVAVSACGSNPVKTAKPYCYTYQNVDVKDGKTVSSDTRLVCSDDPVQHIPLHRMGISPKCFENPYKHRLPNGRIIQGMNYACQKPDGSWEVIDGRLAY
jgi:hypothetical protein